MISGYKFLTHLAFGFSLTVISYLITLYFSRSARIMDIPNGRSCHDRPMPRGGGVAIVVVVFLSLVAIYFLGDETHISQPYMITFIASSALVALISLLDDIRFKEIHTRLMTQGVAIAAVMYGGVVLDQISVPFFGDVTLGWLSYPVTFIWIIGLTNAYNFMDGLDGLIGGTTVIAALFLMWISLSQGSTFVYIVCYGVLAGALGFLFKNFPPARIFMGDVGSVFLGFVFAVLAIIAARYDHSHTSFLVVPLLLFHVIYDTSFTLVRRWLRGDNIFLAHRSHLYQLLHKMGYSHLQVSSSQWLMCFMQGLGAIWMLELEGEVRMLVFAPFLLFQVIYSYLVTKRYRAGRFK